MSMSLFALDHNLKTASSSWLWPLLIYVSTWHELKIFIAPSHPHAEVTMLLCPHHEGACALYLKYRLLKPQACKFDECLGCLACSLQLEHDKGYFHILHNNLMDLAIKHFPWEKPSSESSGAFIKIVKQDFGQGVPIQQCCVHFTGTASSNLLQNILS
jgi:hypothetical protein